MSYCIPYDFDMHFRFGLNSKFNAKILLLRLNLLQSETLPRNEKADLPRGERLQEGYLSQVWMVGTPPPLSETNRC